LFFASCLAFEVSRPLRPAFQNFLRESGDVADVVTIFRKKLLELGDINTTSVEFIRVGKSKQTLRLGDLVGSPNTIRDQILGTHGIPHETRSLTLRP